MRVTAAALAGLLASANLPAFSQNAAVRPDALERWRRPTVAFGQIVDGHFVTIGSGLLVTTDRKSVCILTAKHVFFDPTRGWTPTSIRVRLPKDSVSSEEDQGVLLQLIDGDKQLWSGSADGDLAVVIAPDLTQYWNVSAIPVAEFGKSEEIYQGANVMTLGYPMIPGSEYLVSPIARGGIIAWVDPINGIEKPFLIDSNIVHGNSGGPVFHVPTGLTRDGGYAISTGMRFIGVVSKNATEDAPVHVGQDPALRINQQTGKVEQYAASVENIGGIGIIEPVSRARDLIEDKCH